MAQLVKAMLYATQVYTDWKFSLKSIDLCKFMAWCPDVLADKLHLQFDTKILCKKVRHGKQVCNCCRVGLLLFSVRYYVLVKY